MSGSAPLFNNTLTTSIVLAETAKCKGVLPRESIALIFAPLSSNSWTIRKKLNNFWESKYDRGRGFKGNELLQMYRYFQKVLYVHHWNLLYWVFLLYRRGKCVILASNGLTLNHERSLQRVRETFFGENVCMGLPSSVTLVYIFLRNSTVWNEWDNIKVHTFWYIYIPEFRKILYFTCINYTYKHCKQKRLARFIL